ncbi:cyclic nucleotide-binding domain-containing protein [Comamonas sp. JUb58]|uniref:cyclic nucleotide-binding domain-containing protein n=1 Tax=Comamonas sp. JUb58 TaxID=2485114 RepID=UPI0010D8DB70|nr:cyclic nucleotide-binding domain-containing protein [Comamonas sp. JUb58]TDS73635.1 cyclic nucleotide-binding protein [Comamonas sp. JUb58]
MNRLHSASPADEPAEADTGFFLHGFQQASTSEAPYVLWSQRRKAINAQLLAPADPATALRMVWAQDAALSLLQSPFIDQMVQYLEFYQVPAEQTLIQQGELGDYMLIVLSGQVRVDRLLASGQTVHLADTHPGEVLGEMSLFDSSPRFSSCTTTTDCALAVLKADTLDAMMELDASTAAYLLALFTRKLSTRLRQTSARIEP